MKALLREARNALYYMDKISRERRLDIVARLDAALAEMPVATIEGTDKIPKVSFHWGKVVPKVGMELYAR